MLVSTLIFIAILVLVMQVATSINALAKTEKRLLLYKTVDTKLMMFPTQRSFSLLITAKIGKIFYATVPIHSYLLNMIFLTVYYLQQEMFPVQLTLLPPVTVKPCMLAVTVIYLKLKTTTQDSVMSPRKRLQYRQL